MNIRGLPDRLFGKPVTEGIDSVVSPPGVAVQVDAAKKEGLEGKIPILPDPDLAQYLTPEYARKEKLQRKISWGGLVCGSAGAIAGFVVFGAEGGDIGPPLLITWGGTMIAYIAGNVLSDCNDMRQNIKEAQQAYGAGGVP